MTIQTCVGKLPCFLNSLLQRLTAVKIVTVDQILNSIVGMSLKGTVSQ